MNTASLRIPGMVRWGIYLFLFSLCYENFDPLGISASFTMTKLAGSIFAVLCIWRMPGVLTHQHWTVRWLLALWLALAFVTLYAEFSHPVPRSAFKGTLLSLSQCFLLYWLCVNVLRDKRTASYGLLAFAVSAALMSVLMKLGVGRQAIREGAEFERITFLGANANMIAIWAATGIIIITGIVIGNILRWGVWRYVLLAFVLPMLTVMTESGSRGAAISLLLGMACFLFSGGNLEKRLYMVLAALSVGITLFCLSKNSVLADRMSQTVDSGTMAGREFIWPAALKMIEEKPIMGWGMWNPDDFVDTPAIHLGALEGSDPHNVFLAFFVFGGILVGLPFLYMSGWWLYRPFSFRRGPWGLLPLALAVFMLSTMFKAGGFYITKIPWFVLAFASAATMTTNRTHFGRQNQRPVSAKRIGAEDPTELLEPPLQHSPATHEG